MTVLDADAAHRAVQVAGALVGSGCLAVAGLALGGAWWVGAALGAVGIVSGRLGAVVHAVATVALAGGAVTAGQEWLVPVLVVGVVATVEAGAVRDRRTVVRARPDTGRAVAATAAAGGLSALLVAVGAAGVEASVPAMLVAAGASVALLTALRS
ncbi:MAG TPA: hypothetical protein VFU14_00095 [Acidimicrobiales bacterium]|nr:hypothetical protein [Acidimicrobiales bacterium]